MKTKNKFWTDPSVRSEYILVLASMLVFIVCLSFAYDTLLHYNPSWIWSQQAMEQLVTAPFNPALFMLCGAAIGFTTLVASNTIGGFCRHLCFIFLSVPMLFVYAMDQAPQGMLIFSTINIVLFNILTWPANGPLYEERPGVKFSRFWYLVLPFALIVFTVANGGLQNSTLDIFKIYETRRAASASQPLLIVYVMLNVGVVLIPLATATALHLRRYFELALVAVLAVLFYYFYGHKFHIFSFSFVVILYVSLSFRSGVYAIYLVYSSIFVACISLYMFDENFAYIINSIFTGRVFITPSRLNYFWFDFFHQHGHIYWADSKLTLGLVKSAFETTGPRLISKVYSGIDYSSTAVGYANANTGWLGAGYGQAGFIGMLLYTVLNAGLVYFVQSFARVTGSLIAVAGLSVVFWKVLSSVDFTTALFSHGIVAAVLFYAFIASKAGRKLLNLPTTYCKKPIHLVKGLFR